jgi:hypothetical protein
VGQEPPHTHTTFVPFALYVDRREITDVDDPVDHMAQCFFDEFAGLHDLDLGDHYKSQLEQVERAYSARVENSVMVFGAFDDGEREAELRTIRDHLNAKGYDANLLKDLQGHPARSLRNKAKTFAMSSRFCVLVDIDASGHLIEYETLRGEGIPIAILRPEGGGSTWMAGVESQTNDFIEIFEFQDDPLEAIDNVIDWSEDLNEERVEGYSEYYPGWWDS